MVGVLLVASKGLARASALGAGTYGTFRLSFVFVFTTYFRCKDRWLSRLRTVYVVVAAAVVLFLPA